MSSGNAALTASLQAFAKLVEQSAQLGANFVQSLLGSSPQSLQGLGKLIAAGEGLSGCDSCRIPPPCWMPRPLCEVNSLGRPGDTASLCFVVTNCTMVQRTVTIFTSSSTSGVIFNPSLLDLGPMERREITVSYVIPAGSPVGEKTELLMWVRGCRLYFLRWTVTVGLIGASSCYEVNVKDCPDLVHHWYDHFYCPRACLEERGVPPNR